MNKDTMPSHYKVFEYWKDKTITKDLNIVSFTDYPDVNGVDIIDDWGEPECWCCGKFVNKVYSHKDYENNLNIDGGLDKIWEYKEVKTTLNRCHIISKQFNGNNNPENIFLMCESCHIESPDTTNPKIFFAWVIANREKYIGGTKVLETIHELNVLCKTMNVKIEDIIKVYHNDENYIKNIEQDLGMHGWRIVPSTYAGAMINTYLKDNETKELHNILDKISDKFQFDLKQLA